MLNKEVLSALVIKHDKFTFVWDSVEIAKEKTTLWFVDSDNKTLLKIPVNSLTKEHFLEGVKNYFGSTPYSIYLELPLNCECDGCTDGEDEEVEFKVLAASESLELLYGVFDRRRGK